MSAVVTPIADITFPGTFRGDLLALPEPEKYAYALCRFGDGEAAILQGREINTADGWTVPAHDSLFTKLLRQSFAYIGRGYHIGISCPCCDPYSYRYFGEAAQKLLRVNTLTFSNLFVNSNHRSFMSMVGDMGALSGESVVGCATSCEYRIPENVVNGDWLTDPMGMAALMERLYASQRPIFVAAGPASNIIIHHYWLHAPRPVTILDVGSALDVALKKVMTRGYHDVVNFDSFKKVCSWDPSSSLPLQTEPTAMSMT